MEKAFHDALAKSPIIAILRHLAPANAAAVGEALIGAGVSILEIPLNGREALATLEALAKALHAKALIGAGTVLTAQDVGKAAACGARFILSPNMDAEVIGETRRLGLASIPSAMTPTEAFAALKYGATALKLFPGEFFSPNIIKAFRTVLPPETLLVLSGGVNIGNIRSYFDAGVKGFGVTSALFAPNISPGEIGLKAKKLVTALNGGE
jgi:2-dehydro-3-deoxyphosphogalactonate aldolase